MSKNAQSASGDSYPRLYLEACRQSDLQLQDDSPVAAGNSKHDGRLANFLELYKDLKCEGVAERVRTVYAERLYFCDTLKVLYDHHELAEYLEETANRVDFNRVVYHQVVQDVGDWFVQWSMETGFMLLGKLVHTKSVGMSHIRLDRQGKVVLHQDFWDNTEGLFRHLPVIGPLVNTIKKRF